MELPIKDTISLNVVNNTNLPQQVNMLGGSADPLGVPPHLLYQWNLASETYFGSVTATIVISTTANPTPITYTVQVDGYNIQAVAYALNTLNMGLFQVSNNIIYASNDFYIYGALTVNSNAFISTWDTSLTLGGSSASNQIQLPLQSTGVYNFVVDWGDGTQDTITSWNQAETLHTYATAGIYTIGLVGTITEWSFGTSIVNDNQKFLSISSGGSLQFGVSADLNFYQCINLELLGVTDVPDLSATTYLQNTFDGCTSLTTINRSNEWNTSNLTALIASFANCVNFDSDISSWDVSNVTNFNAMFADCHKFNSDISGWNTSNNTDMFEMFLNCFLFNQPIGSWNVANVINFQSTFENATAFNQNIANWDVSNAVNFSSFMTGKTFVNYSSANLDSIYNKWSLLAVQPNLTNVDFGTIKYTLAGQAGKNILTGAPNNWQIFDGGI